MLVKGPSLCGSPVRRPIVRVESAPHGLLIKVRMDDGASCRFGTLTHGRDEMQGVCICNELGGKPERFWWEVRRAY